MISKGIAYALAIALAVAMAGLAGLGIKLYFVTVELSACKEKKAEIQGTLDVQSEKVRGLGEETERTKARYREAMKKLKDAGLITANLSAELDGMKLAGTACADAMPIVNKVIEATR